ncbi:MAG: nucleotidyltransferase domain-containing protein [Zoogloeaceae bacterium]|jgi:predicted nucleotidyltransferase|nr:nucleotidyltransferase domain-containing protein [Zoogloeaceae bacterium]
MSARFKLRSAHPVEDGIRADILATLSEIERQHAVTVLYACESGSRAWGFASPDSDYDVRFIYVHRLPWYLTVDSGRDVIELPINDALDVSGWELRKTLQLLLRSNPVLLEWLDSPIVYRAAPETFARLQTLATDYFSSIKGHYHYLHMAQKNFRGYLQTESVRLKKYLYVLRPLLAARWIEADRGQPPMRFADLAGGVLDDASLLEEIDRLLVIKMAADETEYSPRWPRIHAFIEQELERLEHAPRTEHSPPPGMRAALDDFLRETVLRYDAVV